MIASRNYAPLVANFFNYQTPPQHQTLIWQENTQESGDLNQFLALARRRGWLLIGTSLVVSSGVAVKSLDTLDKNEIYTGKFRLLVEPANLDSTSNFLKKNSGQSISSLDDPNQIQVLWSNQVISPIAESIQVKYPEINSDILARKLKINRLDHTKIWEISYQDAHPEKIKFVLEQVAQGYIKYSLNQQQVNLQQGLEFAEIKLSNLQTEIEQIETELEQFRQENNLLEPSIQVQTLSRALSNVRIARETTQRELAERESLAKNLQAQLELDLEAAIKVVALSAAPRYQELLSQLQEIEQQIAFESARFTENNPVIQKLQAQKQNLLSLLEKEAKAVLGGIDFNGEVPVLVTNSNSRQLQVTQDLVEINNQILLLQSRERNLAIAELDLQNSLDKIVILEQEYANLQKELERKTANLQKFSLLRENLRIKEAQTTVSWQLLDEIELPAKNSSFPKSHYLLISAIAGLFAGAGVALVTEKIDRVFHSTTELEESLSCPILASIPFNEKNPSLQQAHANKLGVDSEKISTFSEAFRSLNSKIKFLSSEPKINSLVVSSAVAMEGKSTISCNLAQAAAAMGQKVLLVDADLRRPQVHLITEMPNIWGFSQVITEDIPVQDVIQKATYEDNLYILTAGKIPTDPTQILGGKKLRNLIKVCQKNFDLVIFDTPPLLGLVDARLLAKFTDGIVMVVGLERTNKSIFKETISGLQMSQSNLLGVVANGIKGDRSNSGKSYASYYPAIASSKNLSLT